MNLIEYLPQFLREFAEYKVLFDSLDIEVQDLKDGIMYAVDQASIMNCDEERVKEWESFLRIDAQGDLYQRKLYIVATLTTVGKLNKKKIEDIVNIYTNGGGCIVKFEESTIKVQVKPPNGGEIFLFPDIERTLDKMKPAHLALLVTRFYSKYSDIKTDFADYQAIKDRFDTYNQVFAYIKE